MSQKDKLSRREIGKAGLIAAAAVLGGSASSASAEDPGSIKWSHEADIVCVGGGAAGLTAAAIAHGNGDDVILLEAMPALGGTTAKSGGVFWIPNNHILRKHGIKDRKIDCLRYMVRAGHPEYYLPNHPTLGVTQFRYDLLSAYYDNGAPMVERLEKMGVFKTGLWDASWLGRQPDPAEITIEKAQPDYQESLPENKVPRGRSICPYRENGMLGGGMDLVRFLERYLRNAQQRILLKHRVRDLVKDETGAVIGVVAETGSETVLVRARKGVIFGSGGYAQNLDLRGKYQRNRIYGTCSGAGSRGDFIPMAAKAGAALADLGSAWRADGVVEEALANGGTLGQSLWYPVGDSMVCVNKHGDRVVNEYRSYNSRAKSYAAYDATAEEYPNQLRFMIFDARTRELCAGRYPLPPVGSDSPNLISAQTIEQLVAALDQRLLKLSDRIGGVRLASDFSARLGKTIARFNGFARAGNDEDFGRGKSVLDRHSAEYALSGPAAQKYEFLPNKTMYPIAAEGPYYAVIVGMAVLDTNGGPVIDGKGQVVDYDYKPIPGLYAAGNCSANPGGGETYFAGGATIGAAMTFAYLAANAAHQGREKK